MQILHTAARVLVSSAGAVSALTLLRVAFELSALSLIGSAAAAVVALAVAWFAACLAFPWE